METPQYKAAVLPTIQEVRRGTVYTVNKNWKNVKLSCDEARSYSHPLPLQRIHTQRYGRILEKYDSPSQEHPLTRVDWRNYTVQIPYRMSNLPGNIENLYRGFMKILGLRFGVEIYARRKRIH